MKLPILIKVLSLALVTAGFNVHAQSPKQKKARKKTQSQRTTALSPQEQLKKFKVPEGFVVELVASEENGLINPIDLAFDTSGRLWTGTARMYPLDPVKSVGRKMLEKLDKGEFNNNTQLKKIRDLYQRKTKGSDQILIINDPTKEFKGKIPVFAEGMTIPQSFLPYKDGVFVAHGSEMLYLVDKDGDGIGESQETILSGFGFTDTHTMSHTLVRGPGGWIHFSHGALNKGEVTVVKSGQKQRINYSKVARFSLDGENFEIINNAWNNIWGFALKANGQWYGCEANDLFFSLAPLHPYMGYRGIGNRRLRPYQPFGDNFHKFKVEGTGLSGLAYDENGSKGFPDQYKKAGFLANPITSKINLVLADRKPDGSIISKHLPDFLECEDDWFRPVNIEFGPDGCLYIVDWYNKIVSHNEVSRDHPDRDKKHGRIWRVRHKSQIPSSIPNITKATNQDLLKYLQAEILWEKRSAWTEIVDRNAKELVPGLIKLVSNQSIDRVTRIHSLWALEGLKHYDLSLLLQLIKDKDPDIRRETLRSLVTFKPNIEDIVKLTQPLMNDPHYMVKEQLLRTLKNVGVANEDTIKMIVTFAKPQKNVGSSNIQPFGDGYEESFQSFLAFMALEEYPSELASFLESAASKELPSENIHEATKMLPKIERGKRLISSVLNGTVELDLNTLVALSPSMKNPKVIASLREKLETKEFINLALQAQTNLKSSDLHAALKPGLEKLFASGDPSDQQLALRAVLSFQHMGMNQKISELLSKKDVKDLTIQDLNALRIVPKENVALFKKIIADTNTPLSTRVKAALGLTLANGGQGKKALDMIYSETKEKQSLINELKGNSLGMYFLMELHQSQKISGAELSTDDKERMILAHSKHPAAKTFRKEVKLALTKQKKLDNAKVDTYAAAYNKNGGDVEKGKLTFITCLQCHQAGTEGKELAPALDGSKNRDLHHMLTAIVKPNEAIEGGYRVYRITKKTGDIEEGYMFNKNAFGTTIAYMGGGTKFIPKEQIDQEQFVSGKSFMIPWGSYTEEQMADLIAYLKTL